MLTFAEIARRGTVRDAKALAAAIDCARKVGASLRMESQRELTVLPQAITFDQRRGLQAVGAPVRDAAAYFFWAVARTSSDVLAPFTSKVTHALIPAALFDREIAIRRASSAAFQEFVGRLNLGVEAITLSARVDFFSVSSRRRSFLEAAPEVARASAPMRAVLLAQLSQSASRHYDAQVRVLAAQSLGIVASTGIQEEHQALLQHAVRFVLS